MTIYSWFTHETWWFSRVFCLFTRGYIENVDPFFPFHPCLPKKSNLRVNIWILVEQVSWFPTAAQMVLRIFWPVVSRVGFIQDAPKIQHLLHFVVTSCGLKTEEREREREEKKHTPSYFIYQPVCINYFGPSLEVYSSPIRKGLAGPWRRKTGKFTLEQSGATCYVQGWPAPKPLGSLRIHTRWCHSY